MEIRAEGPDQPATAVAVTMRTPGGDFELAVGFLYTEALIAGADEVRRVSYCEDLDPDDQHYNVVTVELTRPFDADGLQRSFFASSSCGICGKATLDDVEVHCAPLAPGPIVGAETISAMPQALRERQRVFEQTGGLHAAALFTPGGDLLSIREDVGRHNAVDKIVGEALLAGRLPLAEQVLQVSGRIGFEIVQKAARAGIAAMTAVGAPSSLAVEAAERLGLDEELRRAHAHVIDDGERAWAHLLARLRGRVAEAVGEGALLPAWFTTVLGPIPPAEDTRDWMEAATHLLAYRVTYGITDPVVALGSEPGEGHTARRRAWHQQLKRQLRDLQR
jgi:FdhD protein